jgi:hypothetical protein
VVTPRLTEAGEVRFLTVGGWVSSTHGKVDAARSPRVSRCVCSLREKVQRDYSGPNLLLRAHSFRDHVDNDPQRQLNRWASSARTRETGGWSTEQVVGKEFGEGHCAGVAVPLEAGL